MDATEEALSAAGKSIWSTAIVVVKGEQRATFQAENDPNDASALRLSAKDIG